MATATSQPTVRSDFVEPDYPTSDGRPMGETDLHRTVMFDTINTLIDHYAGQQVYVTGNLLLFYEQGNRRKHVSPDCMVVFGAEMLPRDYYLLWAEGRNPNAVIEVTSKTTRREDLKTKMALYRDVIRVNEYFLFDPTQDYLVPRLQGYKLSSGAYAPIEMLNNRLPSQQLSLELEADGTSLRFFNPATGHWLPTPAEAREQADLAREQADLAREQAEAENQRLMSEIAELRRKLSGDI